MIVDMHAHALSQRFLAELEKKSIAGLTTTRTAGGEFVLKRPGDATGKSLDKHLHDLPTRLESLRRRKVEHQLFGPPPGLVAWPGHAAGVELARALNLQQAEVAAQSEGLMEAIAVLAMGEPDNAPDELRRAIGEYGFRAALLPTTAGGRPLDDPAFRPLFKLAEEVGVTLIMHPTSGVAPDQFGKYVVQVLVGWPGETTLAIARLIFDGLFERHPALKLVAVHGGGNVVFLKGRLDAAFGAKGWEADPYFTNNISKPPSDYLRRLYYDTCTLSVDSNRFLIETMGVDRVVFGSDYPFDIGDPEGRHTVPLVDALAPEARERIYRGNALALLETGRPK